MVTNSYLRGPVPKGILVLVLTGAIPLTLVGVAGACFLLVFSDDPNVSLIGWFLYAGGVLAVFEVFAWLPLWAAWKLSKRQEIKYAYLVASVPLVAFVLGLAWFLHSVTPK